MVNIGRRRKERKCSHEFEFMFGLTMKGREMSSVFDSRFCHQIVHFLLVQSEEFPAFTGGQILSAKRLVEFLRWIPVEHMKVKAAALLRQCKFHIFSEQRFSNSKFTILRPDINVFEKICLALPG